MADNKVNSGLLEFSEDQKVFVALDAETSEVKKAVTIDGDGVETDIQGVQPTGKKEITSTAEVNVASYATAQVVDEDLVAGNIKKDVDILGVVGSYEPEAPASDYSTANVTIEASGEYVDNLILVLIVDDKLYITNGPDVGTFQTILYKGEGMALYNDLDLSNISVTGNATLNTTTAPGRITITGDCTITYNGGGL